MGLNLAGNFRYGHRCVEEVWISGLLTTMYSSCYLGIDVCLICLLGDLRALRVLPGQLHLFRDRSLVIFAEWAKAQGSCLGCSRAGRPCTDPPLLEGRRNYFDLKYDIFVTQAALASTKRTELTFMPIFVVRNWHENREVAKRAPKGRIFTYKMKVAFVDDLSIRLGSIIA